MYELKNQDVTPPPPDPDGRRSISGDGLAAIAIAFVALGLIVFLAYQVIN